MPERPKTLQQRVTLVWASVRTAQHRAVDVWRHAIPGELTPAQWEEARAIERELGALRTRLTALAHALPEDREGVDAA
jgi:hypothetical protein